jgi:hypothetical protein
MVPGYFIPNGTEESGLLMPQGSRKGKESAKLESGPCEKIATPVFVLEPDNKDKENTHGLAGGRMIGEPSEEEEEGVNAGDASPCQKERCRY